MNSDFIKKLRAPKFLDMAIFDWVASLLIAFLVGKYILSVRGAFSWSVWLVVWTAFGVWAHWFVGVPTMFGYYLSINPKPER